jgi:hypothetical protein
MMRSDRRPCPLPAATALFACLAPFAHFSMSADDPKPAPSTAPAAAPLPSPKAVALAFAGLIEKGDASAAKALVPQDALHAQWVDATVALASALKRLDAAAVGKFGEAGGRTVSQNQLHLAASLKSLEQAQEKVDGDTAALSVPDWPRSLLLKRVDRKWQLQVGPSSHLQIDLLQNLAQAADRTAGEIAANEYATPAAARTVFAARVLDARLRD